MVDSTHRYSRVPKNILLHQLNRLSNPEVLSSILNGGTEFFMKSWETPKTLRRLKEFVAMMGVDLDTDL